MITFFTIADGISIKVEDGDYGQEREGGSGGDGKGEGKLTLASSSITLASSSITLASSSITLATCSMLRPLQEWIGLNCFQ